MPTSYKAAFRNINIEDLQETGRRLNNWCKNSHLTFRRRKRAFLKFKSLIYEAFIDIRGRMHNYFNHERHLITRQTYEQKRTTPLQEWLFVTCIKMALPALLKRVSVSLTTAVKYWSSPPKNANRGKVQEIFK